MVCWGPAWKSLNFTGRFLNPSEPPPPLPTPLYTCIAMYHAYMKVVMYSNQSVRDIEKFIAK